MRVSVQDQLIWHVGDNPLAKPRPSLVNNFALYSSGDATAHVQSMKELIPLNAALLGNFIDTLACDVALLVFHLS